MSELLLRSHRIHLNLHPTAGRPSALLLALMLAWVAPLSGCNRGPAMAQVRGKVLNKDGSVPHGGVCVVRFEPAADTTAEIRKGATGNIGPDGTFELYTRIPGDGIHYGEYAVTFAVWKSLTDQTSLIPDKYTHPATTPYNVLVDGDKDDLNFEIEPL